MVIATAANGKHGDGTPAQPTRAIHHHGNRAVSDGHDAGRPLSVVPSMRTPAITAVEPVMVIRL